MHDNFFQVRTSPAVVMQQTLRTVSTRYTELYRSPLWLDPQLIALWREARQINRWHCPKISFLVSYDLYCTLYAPSFVGSYCCRTLPRVHTAQARLSALCMYVVAHAPPKKYEDVIGCNILFMFQSSGSADIFIFEKSGIGMVHKGVSHSI